VAAPLEGERRREATQASADDHDLLSRPRSAPIQ
jgi:hypothetical protein